MSHIDTKLQHSGSTHRLGQGLIGATENAVTFRTERIEDAPVYSRLGNTKNHDEIQSLLAQCHDAEAALVTGSGMSALTLLCTSLLKPGDHILTLDVCYGGTYNYLTKILKAWGVETTFAPLSQWEQALRPNTRALLLESITNPFCVPQDIKKAALLAKKQNVISICDNTFASPLLCKPLTHGFDYVFESATKYINGHSDVIAGVIAGSKKLMTALSGPHAYLGTFLPPTQCMQLLRGTKTMALRMKAHTEHGRRFAETMTSHDAVERVYYGSPKETPEYQLFNEGFGGMVTVRFRPHVDTKKFMRHLKLISDVPSLGGTETTATLPSYTTNWFMTPAEKSALGIDEQVIRFSIGLEYIADIIADVDQAIALSV